MNIQAMAASQASGFQVEHLKHEQLAGRPTSGYSAALTVGDFISFQASPRSRSATSRGATGSPRRR